MSTQKKSLLDLVIDEYAVNKLRRTSRLLFTGELQEGITGDEIIDFHEQLTRRWSSTNLITGVLLVVSGQVAVHVLEAPTPLLFDFLRIFLEGQEGYKLLKNCRICSLTEEVPREFPVWGTRSVEVAKEEFQAPAIWLQCIFETHKNLLEMGQELASLEDGKALAYLQNADSRHFLLRIPSPDKIKSFKDCEELCTVSEYLEIFDTPVDFTLESEKVWPEEPFLTY